ncbi:hypothetical protein KY349_01505 [Candidatus Woesearchaeota archaeon]|jgi:hypothetical protein|nr:hypothetical protein [Candidatus Woesearchaeota archaeon]
MQFGPRVDIPYDAEAHKYMKIVAPIVITVAAVLYLTGFPWIKKNPLEPKEPSKIERILEKETPKQPPLKLEPNGVYRPSNP